MGIYFWMPKFREKKIRSKKLMVRAMKLIYHQLHIMQQHKNIQKMGFLEKWTLETIFIK
jgi:hypothetical protein